MLGKLLLTISAVGLILGSPMADYNHTHIFNPRWPPHAKFHTGQTITLSVCLGLMTLLLTYRPDVLLPAAASGGGSSGAGSKSQLRRQASRMAAFTGSVYWLAGLAAYFFPGADGLDPEFGGPGFPQAGPFAAFALCAVVGGWWLEGNR